MTKGNAQCEEKWSHSSIQEVDQRSGMHGSLATGPILPDRLRVRGSQRGAGAAEGGEAADTHGANGREKALTICAFCLRHAG